MQIKKLWTVRFENGGQLSYPANWILIDKKIKSLTVKNTVLRGYDAYYVVYHAVAAPGFQGIMTKFEFGGVKEDKVSCYSLTLGGGSTKVKKQTINLEEFQYASALKAGV